MPREVGSNKCRRQKITWKLRNPSGIETLPGWHLTAYESYIISSARRTVGHHRHLIGATHRAHRRNYLQSSSLPNVKHPLFCPMKHIEFSLVNLRRAPIGARPGGEISPQLSHHGDRCCLAAARPKGGNWLGKFPAKPYDGPIFQGSTVREQAQAFRETGS